MLKPDSKTMPKRLCGAPDDVPPEAGDVLLVAVAVGAVVAVGCGVGAATMVICWDATSDGIAWSAPSFEKTYRL